MVIINGKHRRAKALISQSRYVLYILNFVFALHLALISYYLSPFLISSGFPEAFIGLLYATGSMITLIAIAYAPTLLKKYGNYTNLLTLGLIEIIAFLGFAFVHNIFFVFFFFLIAMIIPTLIAFSLDIFLEGSTQTESATSGVRGVFLTVANLAWIGAPLVGGFLIYNENYTWLFLVSALVFVPFIFLASSQLEHFKDPDYKQLSVPAFITVLSKNIDIRNIFIASFLLRSFYAIMIIYLPLYLHGVLGMPLSSLGIIVAIAVTAFVLLEIPLGKLEDAYWGEQEVLIIGFAILAIATASLSFITTTSVLIWALVMFISRIGAAMVEVSTEGYFFKQISASDTDNVSAFRMLYPLAYIVSPLLGTAALFFMPLQYIFLLMGIVLLSGILFSMQIHDTR
ncbi:hypothetical protein COB18_02705 [Candidatus Kaiserbacteria bacterium]|nr:MAG: hypothetical protein COB18_02705 [Candidatus Kaiserbacteria bacterium]